MIERFGRWLLTWVPEGLSSRLLLAAMVVGFVVGLLVGVVEYVTVDLLLEPLFHMPLWVKICAPLCGLLLARLILNRLGGGVSSSTSEEYIHEFHANQPEMPTGPLRARILAGVVTIGFGATLGLEGPSIYLGSAVGLRVQKLFERYLSWDTAKLLLTAGAAAGVSAVFQTPATGLIFALESPYRDDVVHRALLPSLIASATAYVTFASLPFVTHRTVFGSPTIFSPLGAGELAGAVAIGVGAGVGGRMFAWAIRQAKQLSTSRHPMVITTIGGLILGALVWASDAVFHEDLTLGPGLDVVTWLDESPGLILIAILFFFRAFATITSVAGGGVGGLFIPLAMQGVLMGSAVGQVVSALDWGYDGVLWPMLGLAAFLAAGYRTPIAAVMFVAETSGSQAVVPALVAAAVSQLVAGSASVSFAQKTERLGHLEQRFALPITSALTTDVMTVPPDATVSEFVWMHAIGRRQRAVPVVDGAHYEGFCTIDAVSEVARNDWDNTKVHMIANRKLPTARPSWTLRDAVAAMRISGLDQMAVTDEARNFIGVVYESEIVRLGEILDQTEGNAS